MLTWTTSPPLLLLLQLLQGQPWTQQPTTKCSLHFPRALPKRCGCPGSSCLGPEWPEQERAEQLARGAALKWASGVFYRPEQLARLGQYRSREVQRTCSLEARIKSVVQSYLEGVKTGVWQLARALEAVQGAREALG